MARQRSSDPTKEIGNASNSVAGWSSFTDLAEDTRQLAWPQSVSTYDKMRNDEQIASLLLSFMGPILGYHWYIDPNGASDEVVEHVADDFGLEIEGQKPRPQRRLRNRFSFGDYLYHSLLKLAYGFMFFEQVYRFGEDEKLHIRKLAPRMPGSIQQIQAAPDGGLAYIRQFPATVTSDALFGRSETPISLFGDLQSPEIPVDRLIAHVNEKEGGNWYGRPWLRAVYRNWLLKDRLLRVDALKHERNGMGVPTGKSGPTTTKPQLAELLKAVRMWKAGETAAVALPPGTDIELKGVEGSLPDTLASIKYHDEQIARRFVGMFTNLGSTQTGSRALGDTFVDLYDLAQQSVAKSITEVTNAHAVEDLVDLNYSIDESAPLLRFRADTDRKLATADMVALINAKAITVDADLEDYIRGEHDLPDREGKRPTDPQATQGRRVQGRHVSKLRASEKVQAAQREPSEVEQKAKVDFEAIKSTFAEALTQLVTSWKADIKPRQIDELVALVTLTAADDLAGMASISATAFGSDLMSSAMHDLAERAADIANDELTAQGGDYEVPDLEVLKTSLSARAAAVDTIMADAISQAAREVAVREAGGSLTSSDIASDVRSHLEGLSDAYLNDELGGVLMQAQNGARRAVFEAAPTSLYASELLDRTTCVECGTVDGTEYESVIDAEKDYPSGGFKNCLGGLRCRGTVIAILDETASTLQ